MARLCWRHLAGQAAASFPGFDAWQFRLNARTLRGRLGACEGASSSQAHAASVVTEAAAVWRGVWLRVWTSKWLVVMAASA